MMDIHKAWSKTQDCLKNSLGKTVFDTWIAPLKPKKQEKGVVTLGAPDQFFKDWVEKHYKQAIQSAMQDVNKDAVSVALEVETQAQYTQNKLKTEAFASRP
jgi:chromosomal replication initiator protein